jgi:hypothetical protein
MDEENYWQRLAARRLSRRRLLVGAAGVGSGLAASSLAGCGGGNEDGSKATPDASLRSTGEPSEDRHAGGNAHGIGAGQDARGQAALV